MASSLDTFSLIIQFIISIGNFIWDNLFILSLIAFSVVLLFIIYRVKKEIFSLSSIIRELDFLGFILANIVMYLFLQRFLIPNHIYIYFIFFAVSFIILCLNKILIILHDNSKEKNENRLNLNNIKNLGLNPKSVRKIFIFIFIKQIFFNVLFYLFPIILIWLSLAGLLYLLNFVSYTPSTHFFDIVTAITIILGIFQFYFQRIESTVSIKIKFFVDTINQNY